MYLVVITGVQFRMALVLMTICSALKYSAGTRGSVELNGMLSFGGEHGACRRHNMYHLKCLSRLLYLCDDAHNVVKHGHLRHPVLGQHGHIENTKVADNDKRALGCYCGGLPDE